MKYCRFCDETKPLSEFGLKNGKHTCRCKKCLSHYYKEYYKNNPDKYEALKAQTRKNAPKYINRERTRAKMYGLSVEQLRKIRLTNNGMCWLCNLRPATQIDHDHITGKIRGHLCTPCNTGLGKLGDSVSGLENAIRYLKLDLTIEEMIEYLHRST